MPLLAYIANSLFHYFRIPLEQLRYAFTLRHLGGETIGCHHGSVVLAMSLQKLLRHERFAFFHEWLSGTGRHYECSIIRGKRVFNECDKWLMNKASMEIIETLFLGYLTPRRKSGETDGREYLWTLCLFFGLLTTILCCHDNFSTVLRSISPLHLLVFAATKLCHEARNR